MRADLLLAVGMADTGLLKREVENAIRTALSKRFRVAFTRERLLLNRAQAPVRDHEFDAVATDRSVVAGVISSAARTVGNKRNTGAVHHATGEIYYLSLVNSPKRFLVCTDQGFFDLMGSVLDGRTARGVELLHVGLPHSLEAKVRALRRKCSDEAKRGRVR